MVVDRDGEGDVAASLATFLAPSTVSGYPPRVTDSSPSARLRALPGIDEVLARPAIRALEAALGRAVLKAAAREAVAAARARLKRSSGPGAGVTAVIASAPPTAADSTNADDALVSDADVLALALRAAAPSLRPVLNATGIPLHTNLGRAPLHPEAVAQVAAIAAGYASLELDLETGKRGHRADHVEPLLCALFGAEAAFAVNNCAAATVLGLAAAGAGTAAVVSRGELVEIGGGFRVPEILGQSGLRLVEVGTTNRTRLSDYAAALDALGATEAAARERVGSGAPPPALLLRVHRSNFALVGFTDAPALQDLAMLARARGVPLLHDLGSGAAGRPAAPGLPLEETARGSLEAGADLVMCSGDKLLGGPQAGLLLGDRALVGRCRTHPLARALRLDKLLLAALEATLRLHLAGRGAELPALAALGATLEALEARAVRLLFLLHGRGLPCRVVASEGRVGGGSLPLVKLASRAVSLDPPPGSAAAALAAELRRGCLALPPGLAPETALDLSRRGFGEPRLPVLARVRDGAVLLDVRCVPEAAIAELAEAAAAALGRLQPGDGAATSGPIAGGIAETIAAPRDFAATLGGEEEV